jgi:acetylornithine deacetylase
MTLSKDLADQIQREVDRLEWSAVSFLQGLVRIPSVTGDEGSIQKYLAYSLQDLSLELDIWCPTRAEVEHHPAFSDDGLPLGDRPVIVGRWPGNAGGAPSLILNGHVDVVPPGDPAAWKNGGPWSGAKRDGQVWGRGSCDMKGGLVAGITAVGALQRLGLRPRGAVTLQLVIGEETGGVGTLAAILRGYRADAAILLEPTSLAICPVGAGALGFRLRVAGRAAHGAMRLEGVSAVEKFHRIFNALAELEQARHADFNHPAFKEGELAAPLSIGKVQAGDWLSTVPDLLVAEGRYGVLPGESLAAARQQFEAAVQSVAQADPWLAEHRPSVEWIEGQFEPADTAVEAPVLAALSAAHAAVCAAAPTVRGVPYGSDLRLFTNHADMPAVLYGPGDVALAHAVDEHVSSAEVMRAAKVLALTVADWCQAR